MLKYVIHYKFSLLLALIIILLSLLPDKNIPKSSLIDLPYLDKLVHMGMYGSLGLVALLELRCKQLCQRPVYILLMLLFLLSVIMEIFQALLIPSRAAEWLDLVANFIGLVGASLAWLILRWLRS